MLGRKLTDVLVLQQIQSVFAIISYIKMLSSIEMIKAKQQKKENRLKHSVTGTFREENNNHKIEAWPICFPDIKVLCTLTKRIAVTTASIFLPQLFQVMSDSANDRGQHYVAFKNA